MSRVAIVLVLLAVAGVFMSSVKAQGGCGPNEIFRGCSSECEPTCRNPDPVCIEECGPAACQCADDFVRNNRGLCIPRSDCPAL